MDEDLKRELIDERTRLEASIAQLEAEMEKMRQMDEQVRRERRTGRCEVCGKTALLHGNGFCNECWKSDHAEEAQR